VGPARGAAGHGATGFLLKGEAHELLGVLVSRGLVEFVDLPEHHCVGIGFPQALLARQQAFLEQVADQGLPVFFPGVVFLQQGEFHHGLEGAFEGLDDLP
jgi:hypothetical protein